VVNPVRSKSFELQADPTKSRLHNFRLLRKKEKCMFRKSVCLCVLFLLCCVLPMTAQQPAASANLAVPPMVNFSGVLTDVNGKPLTGAVGMTFSLYKESQGGAPLWMETQNVQADRTGHYSVPLGSTKSQGLPVDVFASGEARWLGVQAQGQAEQPRVLLMSVPYALKALDAETIGGRPASSFMLAPAASNSSDKTDILPPASITGGGTVNFVPLFTGASTIGNSNIFQATAGNVGIATTTPAAKLDVKGTGDFRDTLTLFPKTTHPALSVFGTAFQVSNAGTVTFVSGQTFPGTGTITGVTAGADLTGGGSKGNVTLNLDTTKVPLLASSNTFNAGQTVKGNLTLGGNGNGVVFPDGTKQTTAGGGTITGVTAGTGLTGGGTTGNVTLNLDTTKIPQLNANNAFTKNNTFAGTVGVGTTAPAAQLDVEAPATASTGIQGVTSSTAFFAAGVFGHASGTSGETRGVYGASDSPSGIGVHGIGAVGGQFETGNGNIFVGRGVGHTQVTIDANGNTATNGAMTAGGAVTAGGGLFTAVKGGTTGVFASSDTGTGVFGSGGIGVLGDSSNGDGVHGINGAGASGVAGINNGSGQGIYGVAAGSTGQGVHGESFGTGASNGFGPDGVDGITHSAAGSGVAGVNDAPGGTGVYGVSTNGGYGFVTPSNVQQDRGAGGWVKAMVFVDPFTQNGTAITRCYNSQASGSTVSTPPCGFSITHEQQGEDLIDFGFQVNDRFVSASPFYSVTMQTCVNDPDNSCLADGFFPLSPSQLDTFTVTNAGNAIDVALWVIVF
jgi:hypothetical protein